MTRGFITVLRCLHLCVCSSLKRTDHRTVVHFAFLGKSGKVSGTSWEASWDLKVRLKELHADSRGGMGCPEKVKNDAIWLFCFRVPNKINFCISSQFRF